MASVNKDADYLKAILNSRVYEVARETELQHAELLSQRLGHDVFLKREDTQPIYCYKIRGAYNKMSSLSRAERDKGVVVASAGNHAQGVAMSAKKLRCSALVIMPETTPSVKVEAVKRWGVQVKLVGDSYQDAFQYAEVVCKKQGKIFVSAFDDASIIAGQGTVALEILKQKLGSLDAVFVPVGGGGLISGMAVYIKQVRPEVKVIGVEPFESDALYRSLEAGRRVRLSKVGIFADGVAVKQIGRENFRICKQYVDEVVRVSTDEICAAIKDVCDDTRTILEPSGALSIAGLKRWVKDKRLESKMDLVAVASGANMSFDRLRHVSERAELGEKREAVLAVTIPETRGSFKQFYRALGKLSISEFNYRFSGAGKAHIFVGIRIGKKSEVADLIEKLAKKSISSIDLSDNEMAKIHARHMVGGRASEITDERIYSFEFPERPGAFGDFLDQIGQVWNITLFHYRNHGSDFGRVLCGIQVPSAERVKFNQFLKKLGYSHKEETDNPVYQLFLR